MILLLAFLIQLVPSSSHPVTVQTPDLVINEGDTSIMIVEQSVFSPLENFYASSGEAYPFEMLSTGNYRGYVGYWKITNGEMFLYKIDTYGRLELKDIFPESNDKMIKADWYNGFIIVKNDYYKALNLLEARPNPAVMSQDKFFQTDQITIVELVDGNVIKNYQYDENTAWDILYRKKKLVGVDGRLKEKLKLYVKRKKKWKDILVEAN